MQEEKGMGTTDGMGTNKMYLYAVLLFKAFAAFKVEGLGSPECGAIGA